MAQLGCPLLIPGPIELFPQFIILTSVVVRPLPILPGLKKLCCFSRVDDSLTALANFSSLVTSLLFLEFWGTISEPSSFTDPHCSLEPVTLQDDIQLENIIFTVSLFLLAVDTLLVQFSSLTRGPCVVGGVGSSWVCSRWAMAHIWFDLAPSTRYQFLTPASGNLLRMLYCIRF